MAYVIFSAVALVSILPLSPLIAKVGLSVCPIMRDHGFLFGCRINFEFVLAFLLLSLLIGNSMIFANKKIKSDSLLEIERSIFLNIIYAALSFLGLFLLFGRIAGSIGGAGSPYGVQIGAVLLSFGTAQVFLLTVALDAILIRQISGMGGGNSLITQSWVSFLNVGPPVMVVAGFFYFSILLFDAQVEGWSTLSDQRPKLLVAFAFLLVWYVVYAIVSSRPRKMILSRVIDGANSIKDSLIKEGGLISVVRAGELKPIVIGLNASRNALKERARLLSSFSKFVSDQLVDQVVRSDEVTLKGINMDAVIMMTDLRDFTTISQSISPAKVVRLLNIYFEDMIQILHENDLVVDKFIGDGLLAYRTAAIERSKEDCCERALRAAIQMLEGIQQTNKKLQEEDLPTIKIGIGIHFGEVVLGAMGSKTRMQYTIIGDSVNRAARIEGLCKELNSPLVISESAFPISGGAAEKFSGPHPVSVKGIHGEILVFSQRS